MTRLVNPEIPHLKLSSARFAFNHKNLKKMKFISKHLPQIIVFIIFLFLLHSWMKLSETGLGWNPTPDSTYPITRHLLDFVKESEEIFKAYTIKRDAAIGGRDLKTINPWENPTFWNYFAPSITCPFPATRVGTIGDGGKWICGLKQISRKSYSAPCIIYSFGVGGDSSFEDELLSGTNCSVFAFDPTVAGINLDTTKYQGRVHFDKVGLGVASFTTNSPNFKSLKEIMAGKGHSWIDILKVDIEGAEFPAFEQIVADYPLGLPFGHLSMEVHLTADGAQKTVDEEKQQFSYVWKWWMKLEGLGLRAWVSEVNHLFNVRSSVIKPWLIEYSFINVKPVLDRLGLNE